MSPWTNWLKSLRQMRRTRKGAPPARRPLRLSMESLEDRVVPTTKLFIDFGTLLPAAGLALSVKDPPPLPNGQPNPNPPPSLLNIVGPNTGPNLTSGKVTLPANADLNVK